MGSVTQLNGYRMSVGTSLVMDGLKLGDSMAVNGACLTVVEMDELRIAAVEATPVAGPAQRDQA